MCVCLSRRLLLHPVPIPRPVLVAAKRHVGMWAVRIRCEFPFLSTPPFIHFIRLLRMDFVSATDKPSNNIIKSRRLQQQQQLCNPNMAVDDDGDY